MVLKDKKTKITFHSGVLTIGGTIIEVAYEDSHIFFDFGSEYNPAAKVNPTDLQGLLDEKLVPFLDNMFDPKIPLKGYESKENNFKNTAVFLSHIHLDHSKIVNYLNPEVPLYTLEGIFQCSSPCHQETYDNEELIKKMIEQQKDMKIPTSLIPYCPHCGKPMTMNLRCDDTFVEDEGWHQAYFRYQDFIRRHQDLKIVYLELGVGQNTPGIIKYPFFRFVERNKNATYICINKDTYCPQSMEKRAYCISEDIKNVIDDLLKIKLEK